MAELRPINKVLLTRWGLTDAEFDTLISLIEKIRVPQKEIEGYKEAVTLETFTFIESIICMVLAIKEDK